MGPQNAFTISLVGSVTRVGGPLSAIPPTCASHFLFWSLSFPICTTWTKIVGTGDLLELSQFEV